MVCAGRTTVDASTAKSGADKNMLIQSNRQDYSMPDKKGVFYNSVHHISILNENRD